LFQSTEIGAGHRGRPCGAGREAQGAKDAEACISDGAPFLRVAGLPSCGNYGARMKTIDRYVLSITLRPLVACVGIALITLLLERMVRLIDLVTNKGGTFYLVARMLADLVPHFLTMAIPLAFFVGVLLAAIRLSTDSEIHAVYGMGIGLGRLLVPVMTTALVLMALLAVIFGVLRPYTSYEYRALVYNISHSAWHTALARGTFFSDFNDRTIIVDDISEGGRKLSGIFMHEEKPNGERKTTIAEEGSFYRSSSGYQLIVDLKQGTQLQTDGPDSELNLVTFKQLGMPLDLDAQSTQFRARGAGELELTFPELWRAWSDQPFGLTQARIASEIHVRLVRSLSILVLPMLAIALGIAAREARRGIGLTCGVLLLVLYHYVLQFGEGLADTGRLTPWVAYWLPFALFTGISAWAFHEVGARPGHNPVVATLDRLTDVVGGLRWLFARWRRARSAA
jgi:lipopolysaccharide export system permease protein